MHPLQTTFATLEGETAWTEALRAQMEAADFAAAQATLEEAVAALDTDFGHLCRAASRKAVALSGWAELAEAIAAWHGAPITGMTLAVANDPDLAFEKGVLHAPHLLLGLYTDETFAWSSAQREGLLAECAGECPAWAGTDEDVEAFLELGGLDALNTALIHHKQRFLIREGDGPVTVPLRYVEFVVGCWWRALRFHQAVADALAAVPLPGEIAVVSGMVDMRPEVVSIHLPAGRGKRRRASGKKAATPPAPAEALGDAPDMSTLGLIRRKPAEAEQLPRPGSDIRRRLATAAPPPPPPPPKRSFFARIFGRS